ncbi:M20/M25/M40 family metallo-hydrolase [Hyphobacterium marinum]|uniref:Carboxypeptidase Q n=1 Tax=Hyphobacterium marinum TaxID=3116574 RepID=A0ABU7M0M9_9PROT|nr:M20/M25/M40 family metallo-hydrolase [Hyphobacterium sp. Y6023]MEE2567092.1 M20/M25/M40 family metallo-hydrolase [Hyphobacterium sp. Y6023]
MNCGLPGLALAFGLATAAHAVQDTARFDFTDQQEAHAEALAETALDSDLAWDILESLTTEVGPRLGGSPQEAVAREWAVRMLEANGFSNVRIEPFDMPYWERGPLHVELTAPFPQRLYATDLGGSASGPEGGIDAGIAFFDSFDDLQQSPGGNSLDGMVVYIDDRMVAAQTGAGYGPANDKRRFGWLEAQARGATALLIRSVGTDSHRMPHTGTISTPNATSELSQAARDYLDAEYPDYLENPARSRIPAIALSGPDADQVERIHEMGEAMRVRIEANSGWQETAQSGNVVGEIPGTDLADEIILIGAHLDSWDEGTGAVDDGAGVAIVTAAARLIADAGDAPRRTIRVVLFGAEEVGLLGAFAYARENAGEIGNIVLASESDFGAGPVWRFSSGVSDEATPVFDAIGRNITELGIIRGDRNARGGGPDIIPLAMAGVPVFRLEQVGTDYFDLHHTPDDTLDKVDPDALAQNVAAWAATVYLAAQADTDFRTQDE